MRKTITAVATLLITVASMAQSAAPGKAISKPVAAQNAPAAQPARPKMSIEDKAKQATEEINKLTPLAKDQYEKIMGVNMQFIKDKMAITGGERKGELTPEQKGKTKTLKQNRNAQYTEILGKDGFAKLQEARKEKGEMRREQRGKGGNPNRKMDDKKGMEEEEK
jgi:hypothetical protein